MVSTYSQLVWQIYLLGLGVACTCFFFLATSGRMVWCRNLVREQRPSVKIVSPSVGCATCVSFSLPFLFAALLHPRRLSLFCLWVLSQVRQSDSKPYIDRVSWQGYLTRFLRVVFIVNWLASSHLIQHGRRKAGTHSGVEKLFSPWWGLIQTAVKRWSDGYVGLLLGWRQWQEDAARYPTDDSGDLNLPSSPPASFQISSEVEQCSKRTR